MQSMSSPDPNKNTILKALAERVSSLEKYQVFYFRAVHAKRTPCFFFYSVCPVVLLWLIDLHSFYDVIFLMNKFPREE